MIVNKSPAASFTPYATGLNPGNARRAFIDLAEQRTVIDDVPNAIADFFEADVFAAEGVAEERLTRLQAERAGRAHAPDLHV